MVRIVIDNYIRISDLPYEIFHEVRKRLTYDNPAYEATLKFRKKGMLRQIPRTVRSYDYDSEEKELLIPRGVLMEFMDYIGRLGLPFTIVDRRQKDKVTVPKQLLNLRSYQEKLIAEGALYPGPGYILQSPPGTGKCCNTNTLIKIDSGWSRMSCLNIRQSLTTFQGQQRISDIHKMGFAKTKIIEANCVYKIECTPEHPLLGVRGGTLKWIRAEELKLDDYICIARSEEDIPFGRDDDSRLLGYLIADGTLGTGGRISLTNDDPYILNDVQQILSRKNLSWREEPNNDKGSLNIFIHGGWPLKDEWTDKYGLDFVLSKSKRVPDYILKNHLRIAEFLGAYLSCKGHDGTHGFGFSSASRELMADITSLLLSFGIICSGSIKIINEQPYYYATIVFSSLRKLSQLRLTPKFRKHLQLLEKPKNTNIDVIPLHQEILDTHFRAKEFYSSSIAKRCERCGIVAKSIYRYCEESRLLSYEMLERLVCVWGRMTSPLLRHILRTKPFFAQITNIEDSHAEVMDITVPKHHNYVGNGFYSHNTVMGLELARREGRKTLWIAHKNFLVMQAFNAASNESKVPVLDIPKKEIGLIGAGAKKIKIGDFLTVATIQTISSRMEELKQYKYEFGTIIIDEVHHAPAATWKLGAYLFAPALTVGLTATSYREDGLTQMLFDCVGPVVAVSDKKLLQKEGVLIVPNYCNLYTNLRYQGNSFADIVTKMTTDQRRNQILLNVIKEILAQNSTNVVLLMSGRVNHVEKLVQQCVNAGLSPIKLIGTMSKLERNLALEMLKSSRPRLLCATFELLNEGFDYPPISHIIFGTPFKNSIKLHQGVGRAQRTEPLKEDAFIIDPVDENRMLHKQANLRRAYACGLGMPVTIYNSSTFRRQ